MRLNKNEIRKLLDLLAQTVVVEPTAAFPFTVTAAGFGYSKDPEVGALQARLSMMLEATHD